MQPRWSGLALVALWVLGWGVGGSLIDAGLIQAQVYDLEGGQRGTLITFLIWSVLWGGLGLRLRQASGAGEAVGSAGPGDQEGRER